MGGYFGYGLLIPHHHNTATSHYRAIYFAAIDPVTSTIKDQFDQPGYRIYINLEKALLDGVVGKNIDETMAFLLENYRDKFGFVLSQVQLKSLSCSLKDHFSMISV